MGVGGCVFFFFCGVGGLGAGTLTGPAGSRAGPPWQRACLRHVTRCWPPTLPPLQGIDFYFANRAHGVKFIDFLQTVVPIRYRYAQSEGRRGPRV